MPVKDLLLDVRVTVYHGTKKLNIVPIYGKGKSGNDYGVGFYTTPILNLAREWSCSSYSRGGACYVYEYSLDISELSILDLTRVDPLHWVAEVLSNRGVDISDGEYREDIDLFLKNYKINTDCFDVIVGYRADDKYFSYIENFVSNSISIELLERAMRMGNLGLQVFIKSKKAFSKLELISCEEVDKKYESLYTKRDKKARSDFDLLRRESRSSRFGTYFVDVLRRL